MEYVLPLMPAEGTSTRRVTTLHLLLAFALGSLGICCLLLFWFTAASAHVFSTAYWYHSLPRSFQHANSLFALFGIGTLLAAVAIAVIGIRHRDWLRRGRRNAALRIVEAGLLAIACALFAYAGQKFPAAIFGVLALLIAVVTAWELRVPARAEATITDNGIRVPKGGGTKSYSWKETEAVLLRHGILSIELSDNRLIQRTLRPDADLDAETIEAFCRMHIKRHEQARAAANAW